MQGRSANITINNPLFFWGGGLECCQTKSWNVICNFRVPYCAPIGDQIQFWDECSVCLIMSAEMFTSLL